MIRILFHTLLMAVSLVASTHTFAVGNDANLQALIARWDEIQFQLPEAQREAAFAELIDSFDQHLAARPEDAALLTWRGLSKASYAGAKGGFGALSVVKSAKADLQRAIELNGNTHLGTAYTTLGSLYYQVPGWPLAFGDDEMAEAYLKKALALDPRDIDAHYFYADFLVEQGKRDQARQAFQAALDCPPKLGRPLADSARRDTIKERLKMLE